MHSDLKNKSWRGFNSKLRRERDVALNEGNHGLTLIVQTRFHIRRVETKALHQRKVVFASECFSSTMNGVGKFPKFSPLGRHLSLTVPAGFEAFFEEVAGVATPSADPRMR